MSQEWPADSVERWPIDRLIPYAKNARTHSDAQVAQIAASIREFGWTMPVLADETGGLIAGHARVLAARQLGLRDLPVMVARGWSAAQKRAYVLADNKLSINAGWDDAMLRAELADLGDLGADLSLTGFSEDDLSDMGIGVHTLSGLPSLPSDDKPPFQQMTFTLHDDQAESVRAALDVAGAMGPYGDDLNENSNGNALARVCEMFLAAHG